MNLAQDVKYLMIIEILEAGLREDGMVDTSSVIYVWSVFKHIYIKEDLCKAFGHLIFMNLINTQAFKHKQSLTAYIKALALGPQAMLVPVVPV